MTAALLRVRAPRPGLALRLAPPDAARPLAARAEADLEYAASAARTAPLVARLAAVPDAPQIVASLAQRRVTVDGEPIELTRREFDLLAHLLAARGRVVTRAELRRTVWCGQLPARSRSVDVHVHRLRSVPELAGLIATVHGRGYRIAPRPHVRIVP